MLFRSAAIGVSEAVAVTMREAARLHAVGPRVMLFLVVIALFATVFGVVNIAIQRLMRWLSEPPTARQLFEDPNRALTE